MNQKTEVIILKKRECQTGQIGTLILNTSKNELIEIFRGFRVFEYALWQKRKLGIAGNQQKAF